MLVSFCFFVSYANNIQVSNVTLTGQNTNDDFTLVQFDLSWENSWRINEPSNEFWDASWIFVKYRIGNSDQWRHATLDNSTAVAPAGCTVNLTTDGKGAFVYRSAPGEGINNWAGIKLKWLYGNDLLDDNAIVDIKVFAIEMVYVPEGSFWVGDGVSENRLHDAADENSPFLITSEDALTLGGTTPGNLASYIFSGNYWDDWNWDGGYTPFPGTDISTAHSEKVLSASFPKGFKAFYCMKYELSEGQYVDFLNCLTRTQQQPRVRSDISSDVVSNYYVIVGSTSSYLGNTVHCPETNNGTIDPIQFFSDSPDRACIGFLFHDIMAYLDWSALRPMTCLEYEKACRGANIPPLAGEFAWGTADRPIVVTNVENEGTPDEKFTYPSGGFTNANALNGNIPRRPFRCGIFAASAPIKNRVQTGGTFYGIMEMTGNVREHTILIEFETGRAFDGTHGNGQLDIDGNYDIASWVYHGWTLGAQGGDFNNGPIVVSDKWNMLMENGLLNGIRGVRTAE